MDFHPLVIHYPIAFLTVYAVFELLRFKWLTGLPCWFNIKVAILIIGEISAIATLLAAVASDALSIESALADMYKLFMFITAIVFGIIAILYGYKRTNTFILIPLAVVGLFFIVVAGGLFGATVYGTQFDPYLAPIFKLLRVF